MVVTLSDVLVVRHAEHKIVGREKIYVFVLKYGKTKINKNNVCSECLYNPAIFVSNVTYLVNSSM